MARPTTHPVRKLMSFTEDMLEGVDHFRVQQGIATEVEAVRQLVAIGMGASAGEAHLTAEVEGQVKAWQSRHAPGLEQHEVVRLLLQRGMSRATPDLRPILIPPPKAAPTAAAELAPMTFDEDTERKMALFQKAQAEPPDRRGLVQRLVTVFEDRVEEDLEDFRVAVMPEGTRQQAIERLVKQGLADFNGEDPPTAR